MTSMRFAIKIIYLAEERNLSDKILIEGMAL